MVKITKRHVGNTLVGLVGLYLVGSVMSGLAYDRNDNNKIANYLSNKKDAIVRNIEHYNTNIKIAREPFLSQYKDSLEYAVRDTTELGKEIQTLAERGSRATKKFFLSWAGFFVD